jgi:hypothetical protein
MPKKKTPIKAFPKSKSDKYEGKVYDNPFDARKAADNEDRQNLKEIRAVESTKGMKAGGYCRGAGAAIKGNKFQGVF